MIQLLFILIMAFNPFQGQEITGKAQLEEKPTEVVKETQPEPQTEAEQHKSVQAPATTPKEPVEARFAPESNQPAPQAPTQDIEGLIDYYSALHGSNAAANKKIAWCESTYNSSAVSPSGLHVGIFQFHANTFNANVRYMRERGLYVSENASRWNAEDNINVATWMLANGQQWQWSCKAY